MFKPNEIEAMPVILEGYFKDLENRIMEDIVRRIRINSEITSTADLQIQRLSEMGASKKAVRDYIQQALQLSEQGIDDLYSGAIQKGYNADKDLYTATGRDFVPYAENQQLQQLVEAVKKQTNSNIKNITQSMGFAVRQPDGKLTFQPIADYYQKTLDKAVLDITSGSFDYNTVLKRTVQEMTDSGLRWIDYASGHHNRVPVAVRRAVMTGVNQVAKIVEQNMELLQTEYVEVSWHRGARPSHQVWQGKIYHWKEKSISAQVYDLQQEGYQNTKYDNNIQNSLTNSNNSSIINKGTDFIGLSSDLKDLSTQVYYILNRYTSKKSRWSGKTYVLDKKAMRNISGVKNWDCSISIREGSGIKTVIHEHLHARSGSYYGPKKYTKNQPVEEGAVEFFAQQICKKNGVQYNCSYTKWVSAIRRLNNLLHINKDEFEFAKTFFEIEMIDRYTWLESMAEKYIRENDVSPKVIYKIHKSLQDLKAE